MAREIGWSIESNLLYGIKKKLGCDCVPSGDAITTSTTTTTSAPTTSTTTTSA